MTVKVEKRGTIVALLLAGTFIAILNQTLMITAIPPIMNEMGITANTAQWLTTIFMLVNGIMIPISAFLIDRFTTRQLFLTAMSVFVIGTLVAALAPSFSVLLTGRVIQSAGAGVMLPLMQTVFLMIFPINKRGSIMGMVGLVISFAPAIGPSLSGWITEHYSWRVLFFIILPIAIIDIIIAYYVMKNVTEITKPKLDIPSIILSSLGFGGLLYGFTSAGNNGWDSMVTIVVLIVGVISLLTFILRQLKLKHPMLEFRVFTYSIFPLTVSLGMIAFMGLIAVETLIPLYMQDARDFSAMESGLVILPGALITGFMSPITGRIFDKIGARWLAIIGFALMTAGSFLFTILDEKTSITYLTVIFAIRMLGISMVMMPAATAGLNQLPKKLIAHGAAMDNTLRNVSASVGTAIYVTILTQSQAAAEQSGKALPAIEAFNTTFMVLSIVTMVGLILSFFIKKSRPADLEEEGE
ncbi:DHA2 family efflux MFS transporter permease subunit [Gracilibacillus caseinilyticus]|uniref:DHA2 family efflux MFS transporter permease subunit n=1 Tax=Gracilibacillus caseinilyticus TaxID=2932256 RepID=A0ABY4EZ90_9BACI|nr:DHA2 family efflux MFS transporter permease subunit [Gracilibacillus caseinilyticus]UOQ49227.1 DHA2 family efflux MFS transporter permease subunit [Gracilibacillus caseinilyticus]